MKSKFIFFTLILPFLSFAQTAINKKIFLDSLWLETQEGKHVYYRIIEDYNIEKPLHRVLDYYKNDTLQMKGLSSSINYLVKQGPFVYYYENGKKKTMANYEKNKLDGKEYRWYENGNKKSDGDYKAIFDKDEPSDYTLNQFWDENGAPTVVDGNGYFKEENENFSESGKITDGHRDGEWKGEDRKLKIKFVENYKNGTLITGISTDSMNVDHNYNRITVQPQPKKGFGHFYNYIGKKFKFTKETEGQYGKVFLLFYIEPNGDATDIKVIQSAGEGLDNEAIRLISKYPEWESGWYRGIKYRYSFTIPIVIQKPSP